MSNNQKDQHAGNKSEERTKGFEKENTNPNGAPEKQQTPSEEVPNVGDHEKKGPTIPPTYKPSSEKENKKNDKEESLSEIVNQGKGELEESQPEVEEVK